MAVYDTMAALPNDVAAFLREYSSDELCLSADWFALLFQFSPPEAQRLRIYVVRAEDSNAVDCVLFAATPVPPARPRRLLSLTNFYTMSYAPLVRPGLANRMAAFNSLAQFIARERPKWDVVDLRGFIKENRVAEEFLQAFRRAGFVVSTYLQFENWSLPTRGISADEYFKSRPSQVRNTIARKWKKLQREHEPLFRLYTSVEDLDAGLSDYQTIYQASWKNPETYPDFIPQLLRWSALKGQLRLGVLRVDGEPAAAQIWLITGKRATIYKLAYDEKFAALSVGSILTKTMFDHVLTHDGVTEVDYGVGSEPYKLDWMSECRHVVGLIFFNPVTVPGLAAAARHLAGRLRNRHGRTRPSSRNSAVAALPSVEGTAQ